MRAPAVGHWREQTICSSWSLNVLIAGDQTRRAYPRPARTPCPGSVHEWHGRCWLGIGYPRVSAPGRTALVASKRQPSRRAAVATARPHRSATSQTHMVRVSRKQAVGHRGYEATVRAGALAHRQYGQTQEKACPIQQSPTPLSR